ncbi:hypothetical protein R0J92_03040 [Tritonibacter sp. SIMBA_163]
MQMYARELINNGLFSTGARGVNAPHMTKSDLSNTLSALLVTNRPAHAPELVRYFGAMQLSIPEAWRSSGTLPSDPDHTFSELLECFCDPLNRIPSGILINIIGTSSVEVCNQDVLDDNGEPLSFTYYSRELMARLMDGEYSPLLDQRGITRSSSIDAITIEHIKAKVFEGVDPAQDPHLSNSATSEEV